MLNVELQDNGEDEGNRKKQKSDLHPKRLRNPPPRKLDGLRARGSRRMKMRNVQTFVRFHAAIVLAFDLFSSNNSGRSQHCPLSYPFKFVHRRNQLLFQLISEINYHIYHCYA